MLSEDAKNCRDCEIEQIIETKKSQKKKDILATKEDLLKLQNRHGRKALQPAYYLADRWVHSLH